MKRLLIQTRTAAVVLFILTDNSFHSCLICIIENVFINLFLVINAFHNPANSSSVKLCVLIKRTSLIYDFVLVQFVVLHNLFCWISRLNIFGLVVDPHLGTGPKVNEYLIRPILKYLDQKADKTRFYNA